MHEALRRRGTGEGGSTVRRLMTRPIRTHIASAAQPRPPVLATPAATPEPDPAGRAGDLDLLRMEVLLMKAALAAERRESEALRTCLGLAESETLSPEARAERERWAALVGRLIHGLT